MKKIALYILLLLLLLPFSIKQSHAAGLDFWVWDHAKFRVVLNDIAYDEPVSRFKLDQLQAGKHRLRVFRDHLGPTPYSELLFSGYIDIPEQICLQAKITAHNTFQVLQMIPLLGFSGRPSQSYSPHVHTGNHSSYHLATISPAEIKLLKEKIAAQAFDRGKLEVALRGVENHPLSSEQQNDLMNCFHFERTKIKFAQKTYPQLIDRQNFETNKHCLFFSRSQRRLYDISGQYVSP